MRPECAEGGASGRDSAPVRGHRRAARTAAQQRDSVAATVAGSDGAGRDLYVTHK